LVKTSSAARKRNVLEEILAPYGLRPADYGPAAGCLTNARAITISSRSAVTILRACLAGRIAECDPAGFARRRSINTAASYAQRVRNGMVWIGKLGGSPGPPFSLLVTRSGCLSPDALTVLHPAAIATLGARLIVRISRRSETAAEVPTRTAPGARSHDPVIAQNSIRSENWFVSDDHDDFSPAEIKHRPPLGPERLA
jgi:hypothetical protein